MDASHLFSAEEIISILTASLSHDVGHDGFNNNYHINAVTDLAIR